MNMGLLFNKEQLLVPASSKECVLQVLHGDNAGQTKMLELAKNPTWKSKQSDIEENASNCLICFKAGKNLKPVIALNKANRDIPKPDQPGLELQIVFAGPFFDEVGITPGDMPKLTNLRVKEVLDGADQLKSSKSS